MSEGATLGTTGNGTTQAKLLAESMPSGFFHVAIDCPGYGGTPGNAKVAPPFNQITTCDWSKCKRRHSVRRQVVRSNPTGLFREVLASLAKSHAFAVVGASQGASAVLTAAKEDPSLCNFVVVSSSPRPSPLCRRSTLLPTPLRMQSARNVQRSAPCPAYDSIASQVRTPFAPTNDLATFSRLLPHTLIFAGEGETEGAHKLASAIVRAKYVEGSGGAEMNSTELADRFVEFCEVSARPSAHSQGVARVAPSTPL